MTVEPPPEFTPLDWAFKGSDLKLNALFIAATIGNGFIADAIVSEILTLCKSFSGPVLAGE